MTGNLIDLCNHLIVQSHYAAGVGLTTLLDGSVSYGQTTHFSIKIILMQKTCRILHL